MLLNTDILRILRMLRSDRVDRLAAICLACRNDIRGNPWPIYASRHSNLSEKAVGGIPVEGARQRQPRTYHHRFGDFEGGTRPRSAIR